MSAFGTIDIIIAIVIGWFALAGARRGLVLATYDIVTLGLTFAVATQEYHVAGAYLATKVPLPAALSDVAGFVAVLVVGEILRLIGGLIVGAVVGPIFWSMPTLGYANRLGGLIPGALRGLAYVAVVLIAVESLPFLPSLQGQIQRSSLASNIMELTSGASPALSGLMDVVVHGETAGVPTPSDPLGGLTNRLQLPSGIDTQPDPTGEQQVLAMTNLARTQAGVPPLQLDSDLSAVAEQHSLEMFRLAYFAHQSPVSGDVPDRLQVAGISYTSYAENIAYAPSLSTAFSGLMNSPEHRQNLLATAYTRVGIGVAQSDVWGYMVTQDFAN